MFFVISLATYDFLFLVFEVTGNCFGIAFDGVAAMVGISTTLLSFYTENHITLLMKDLVKPSIE